MEQREGTSTELPNKDHINGQRNMEDSEKKLRPVTRKVAMEQEYGFLFLLLTSSTVLLEKSRVTQDFRVSVGTFFLIFLPKLHTTLTSTGSASAWPDLSSCIWPP